MYFAAQNVDNPWCNADAYCYNYDSSTGRYWYSTGSSANNGICEDGGPGSEYSACAVGSDCNDCGGEARTVTPPPPPPPPPSAAAQPPPKTPATILVAEPAEAAAVSTLAAETAAFAAFATASAAAGPLSAGHE